MSNPITEPQFLIEENITKNKNNDWEGGVASEYQRETTSSSWREINVILNLL